MLKVLRDRFLALGRGEEGVAMVVTLGIFMFLYVTCASVYAIGMAVKEKMHLQAACDAAAYSAAIVQADTFSRIATINRAMSWTYQQMTKRQMDYIVWQWLEETAEHYRADRRFAEDHAARRNRELSGGIQCERGIHLEHSGWDIDGMIRLNDSSQFVRDGQGRMLSELEYHCGYSGFGNWLQSGSIRDSFYSQGNRRPLGSRRTCGLGLQIDDDLRNIRDMSAVVESLARNLPQRVDEAVRGILTANVPAYMAGGDCQYYVAQERDPRGVYFKTLDNTAYGELVFLSLGNKVYRDALEAFGTGIDDWFRRGGTRPGDSGDTGIHRLYDPERLGRTLHATWTWWSKEWKCLRDPVTKSHTHALRGCARRCGHSHDAVRCACTPEGSLKVRGNCWANNNRRYDNRFNGTIDGQVVWAKPLSLKQEYFGKNGKSGTITVALARRNENPWFSLFGRVGGGLYSAFSPVSNSWSYCFASAKAGYKLYHVPEDYYIDAHRGEEDSTVRREDWEERYNGTVRVHNGPRDYCVDWKPEGSRFQDWITPWKRDERGNYVYVNGKRVKENYTIVYFTNPTELRPSWRQSWNLVQDDWDAVMVPVRQGGSMGYETEHYSLREWWRRRIEDYQRDRWKEIPYRFEPVWQNRDGGYLASLVNNAQWKVLSGTGSPDATVRAGPVAGDWGDTLNGRLAGRIWEDHRRRGVPPPQVSGRSLWNVGNPGNALDWNHIGDEMYH